MVQSSTKIGVLLALLLALPNSGDSIRVLGVFPMPVQSHWNVGHGVMRALAEAGHDVTVITPFEVKNIPNYRTVPVTEALDRMKEQPMSQNMFKMMDYMVAPVLVAFLSYMSEEFLAAALENKNVINLLNSNEKFDVVITEVFQTEVFLGFGQHFNAPTIAVSTFGAHKWFNELVGTPSPSSFVPHPFLSYTDEMTYTERLINTMFNLYDDIFHSVFHHKWQRVLYNKYFPNSKLSYDEVIRNVSLVFLNAHVSIGNPKPYAPNMIEIGGINIPRKESTLPKEFADYLDAAKEGVIYFSMGSNLKSSQLPPAVLKAMVDTFAKLKERVLWKLDDPSVVENMPPNMLIRSWFPQIDILAHPNVKLFISHGGLLSTTESIYQGKPILGLPVFGDQLLNIAKAEKLGWAIGLDYHTLTAESFEKAIRTILSDSRYAANAKRSSALYRDQILTPQQAVVYWTEYVAKYNGAPHLKSNAVYLNYIQLYNIDVVITLLAAAVLFIWLNYRITRALFRRLFSGKRKVKSH